MQTLLLRTKEAEKIAAWFRQTSLDPEALSKGFYGDLESFWGQKTIGDALSVAFHLTFKPEYDLLVEVVFSRGLGPMVLPGPDDDPSLSWKRSSIKEVTVRVQGDITDNQRLAEALVGLLKALKETERKVLEKERKGLEEKILTLGQEKSKIEQRLATITK